jgi:hypothetical protein
LAKIGLLSLASNRITRPQLIHNLSFLNSFFHIYISLSNLFSTAASIPHILYHKLLNSFFSLLPSLHYYLHLHLLLKFEFRLQFIRYINQRLYTLIHVRN